MEKHIFREGDVIFSKSSEHAYKPYKILKIEIWPNNTKTWHLIVYVPISFVPSEQDIASFEIQVLHAPITSLEDEVTFLANLPITAEELEGYHHYLKMTNFEAYLEETKQDLDEVIKSAQEYYSNGCNLADEKKYEDAIESYSQAIEIFPLFYEAVDNRGLAKMDLSDYKGAADDFKLSLAADSKNFTAQFSLGECYFKLGEYQKAKEEIAKAQELNNADFVQELLSKIEKELK